MSGILLPGQDKEQPEGGGRIEIAKGFSSPKRESSDVIPPQEETTVPGGESLAPEAPQAEAPAAPSQRQAPSAGQQPEFAFPPSGAQVQCPNCGTPFQVPVFTIIDFGENPELRMPLLSGQINVAACPNCNSGGPLSAPLMVHDPENAFLGVFVPQASGMDDMQSQRIIGDLTQTLMRKLPSESRKGYMLQAKQFFDWQRFTEVLWGFEGVTPEMLRRQREQSALLQRLAALANDPKALEIAIERDKSLIDADIFAMLDRIIVMSGATDEDGQPNPLLALREALLDNTEAGAEVRAREDKIRGILSGISQETTREELLDVFLTAWDDDDGEQVVPTLIMAVGPLIDYEFLMGLSQRIDAGESDEEREKLEMLRELVLEMQEIQREQRQNRQPDTQQAQAVLQEVLQATDVAAKLNELSQFIDEGFLGLLAGNIQHAEQSGATGAAKRLREVYQLALKVMQDNLPPELRLVNELMTAPDPAAARALLKENRDLLTPEFVNSISSLEADLRQNGQDDLADRIKSLRGQISLML